MDLWVVDTCLVIDLAEGDPGRKAALAQLGRDANAASAMLTISAVTVQEYLARPAALGAGALHTAREVLKAFETLAFDKGAADVAAQVQLAPHRAHYEKHGAASKNQIKRWWFRDAAVVGTAVRHGAKVICTGDGPLANIAHPAVSIRRY